MQEFKSGFVSIIGRTNVGKSTIINLLAEEKIAIMVNKPQTTRTAIKAIVNRENSQIIFVDTPGIHKPKTKLGQTMVDTAFGQILEVDVVIFVVEATSKTIGPGDRKIIQKIKEAKKKTILIINKIDLIKKEELLKIIKMYDDEYKFEAVIPINATKTKYREIILSEVERFLKPGPMYYDIDEYTDQTGRQLAEEIIREKALKLLNDEVPHGLYVEIEKFENAVTKNGEEIYNIEATIYCEKMSHKGIIIGKDGCMLKRIGTFARQDIEKIMQTKVNLKTWVKVKEQWQEDEKILKKFK